MAATAEIIEDLECRILRNVRLFPEETFAPNSSHFEWLVCSSKFGIGLALLPDNRVVSYQTSSIHSLPKQSEANDPEVTDLPSRKINYFQTNVQISFIRLSCNERVLAFGIDSPNGAFVHLFDLFAFSPITNVQPFPLTTIKASNGNGKLTCLEWNPESEDVFTFGTSDGSLATIKYSLATPQNFSIVGQITLSSYATCLSWSRKGKQVSVGDVSGRLHQLKPELISVRNIDPPLQIPNLTLPVQCAGVFWVATTDWLIAYRQVNDPLKLTLTFLSVKKNQPPEWTFFGDLTFQRPNAPQSLDTALHFVPLMNWNMIFIFAHRSPDFAIVGQRNGSWITFVMEKYNITMPTNSKKSDTYPIGAAFDLTSNSNIKLNYENPDSPSLSPQPILHVLSSGGLLLPYNICSLDQSRPNLIIAPTALNAQNIMNGPQPANFLPLQQITQAQNLSFNHPKVSQAPQVETNPAIIPQPVQRVESEAERNANLQLEFEKTLIEYCNSKSILINELESVSSGRDLLFEKANNFDIDCIDSLWELYKKVQYSLDDGIQSVDINSRKAANLVGRLKQAESIWKKHISTANQKKRIVMPSSILDDLISAQKRFQQIQLKFEKIEKEFKIVTTERPKDQLDLSFKEQGIDPIPAAEQMRINKVNDEIARRVLKFAKRVENLRQQVRFLKFHSKKNDQLNLEELNLVDPTTTSTPKRAMEQPNTSINCLTSDIQHLLLIVDGKTDFSPFSSKSHTSVSQKKKTDETRNQRQFALKEFFCSKTEPVQIQRVCPKKLIVDETPTTKSTPLRNRLSVANSDNKLQQQMIAAKREIFQSKMASPINQTLNAFGSTVDATSILNAAKASSTLIKPTIPVPTVIKSEPIALPTQVAKLEAATFSFAPKPTTTGIQQKVVETPSSQPTTDTAKTAEHPKQASTPSNFSFAPKKDDLNQSAELSTSTPSTFSFAPKKTESELSTTTPIASKPEDSSAGLTSAFRSLTASQPQPASTPVSFSFTPSKLIADSQQTPSKPSAFSFAPKTESSTLPQGATSSFGSLNANTQKPSQAQPNGSVSFSFAPKTDNTTAQIQPASTSFGQSGFGNTQQQSAGWSGFGRNASTENKSVFGGNTQASNTTSAFGSSGFAQSTGFGQIATQQSTAPQSPFGQPQSTGFGQTATQQATAPQSPFGQPQQQKSAFGSAGFGSGPSFGGTGFGSKSAFGNTTNNTGGSFSSGSGGFSSFANKGSSFGQLAQQSQNQPSAFGNSFGSSSTGFGGGQTSAFGGGQTSAFGGGQTSAFGGGQTSAFGSPQQSSAFTTFRK